MLRSETFTSGLLSNVYHIVMAAAERKLSQPNDMKYSKGSVCLLNPSAGIARINSAPPPTIMENELKINGGRPFVVLAANTFPTPLVILLRIRSIIPTPTKLPSTVSSFWLRVSITTPARPSAMLIPLRRVILSFFRIIWVTRATNSGPEPTIIAPRAP